MSSTTDGFGPFCGALGCLEDAECKLVDRVLEYEGPLTQQQHQDETLLTQRTIYNALRDLEDAGLIESEPIWMIFAKRGIELE